MAAAGFETRTNNGGVGTREPAAGLPNNKDCIPLGHYRALFAALDPAEAAVRTGLSFDTERRVFRFSLMGAAYELPFPEGPPVPDTLRSNETILLLRYLCEGRRTPAAGSLLSYHEIPWGNVYFRQFEGRVLKRAAYTFSGDLAGLVQKIANFPALAAETLPQGDAGFRFMFLDGYFVTLYLYAADDDFPPSAQMLFDDNIPRAFTAEDVAVIGEIVIQRLKALP